MDWRYAVLELYSGDLGRRRVEALFLPLFSSMVEASRGSSSLSISSWESQIWLDQVLFVLLCAAMVVGTGRSSVLGEAADLVIQGIIKLAFSAVNVNLLALLRPLLLELQIKSLQGSRKLHGWLQRLAGHSWFCWQKPMPPPSTSSEEALFKVMAGDGGHSVSGEVAGSSWTRLRFCFIFWGPVCISGGPVCNFYLFWGPLCGIVSLLLL